MRRTTVLAFLALLSLLAACSSTKVGVDRDPTYDFRGKRTYAWKEGIPAESGLNQQRIVSGVDRALGERGLQRIEGGAPDLWVYTEVAMRQETRSTGGSVGVGVGRRTSWGHVGVGTSTGNRIYEVTVGALVIVILDGPTESTVWRARAEDTVTNDAERTAEAIRKAIEKAFEDFPVAGPAS